MPCCSVVRNEPERWLVRSWTRTGSALPTRPEPVCWHQPGLPWSSKFGWVRFPGKWQSVVPGVEWPEEATIWLRTSWLAIFFTSSSKIVFLLTKLNRIFFSQKIYFHFLFSTPLGLFLTDPKVYGRDLRWLKLTCPGNQPRSVRWQGRESERESVCERERDISKAWSTFAELLGTLYLRKIGTWNLDRNYLLIKCKILLRAEINPSESRLLKWLINVLSHKVWPHFKRLIY